MFVVGFSEDEGRSILRKVQERGNDGGEPSDGFIAGRPPHHDESHDELK